MVSDCLPTLCPDNSYPQSPAPWLAPCFFPGKGDTQTPVAGVPPPAGGLSRRAHPSCWLGEGCWHHPGPWKGLGRAGTSQGMSPWGDTAQALPCPAATAGCCWWCGRCCWSCPQSPRLLFSCCSAVQVLQWAAPAGHRARLPKEGMHSNILL